VEGGRSDVNIGQSSGVRMVSEKIHESMRGERAGSNKKPQNFEERQIEDNARAPGSERERERERRFAFFSKPGLEFARGFLQQG